MRASRHVGIYFVGGGGGLDRKMELTRGAVEVFFILVKKCQL